MFQTYHIAWLAAHPHRSADWLEQRLRDGFDIHHLDGDHSNDDPKNLVLIECSDHMALHGVRLCRIVKKPRKRTKQKRLSRRRAQAYYARMRQKLDTEAGLIADPK